MLNEFTAKLTVFFVAEARDVGYGIEKVFCVFVGVTSTTPAAKYRVLGVTATVLF